MQSKYTLEKELKKESGQSTEAMQVITKLSPKNLASVEKKNLGTANEKQES